MDKYHSFKVLKVIICKCQNVNIVMLGIDEFVALSTRLTGLKALKGLNLSGFVHCEKSQTREAGVFSLLIVNHQVKPFTVNPCRETGLDGF